MRLYTLPGLPNSRTSVSQAIQSWRVELGIRLRLESSSTAVRGVAHISRGVFLSWVARAG